MIPTSGQARINAKRRRRAEYWRTVRIRVSSELEPHFRAAVHLLGAGSRIHGRRTVHAEHMVDLQVYIPGTPEGAVAAEPVVRTERLDGGYQTVLVDYGWRDARGNRLAATDMELRSGVMPLPEQDVPIPRLSLRTGQWDPGR